MCHHSTLQRRGEEPASSVVSLEPFPFPLDDFPWDSSPAAALPVAVAAAAGATAGSLSWITGTMTVREYSKVSPWCRGGHFDFQK